MTSIRRQMLSHFPTVTQSTGFQPEPLRWTVSDSDDDNDSRFSDSDSDNDNDSDNDSDSVVTQHSPLITHRSLLTAHYSLLITHYSLLITHMSGIPAFRHSSLISSGQMLA